MLENNNLKLNDQGFTLIESLIAIAIFSIVFMALSSGIWSARTTLRTASFADESVITTQDVVEALSVIDISLVTTTPLAIRGNQLITYTIVDGVDADADGTNDFLTIAINLFHDENGDGLTSNNELRRKSYYRRSVF